MNAVASILYTTAEAIEDGTISEDKAADVLSDLVSAIRNVPKEVRVS